VGPDESDIKNNMISVLSPIARALIGKKWGMLLLLLRQLVKWNMK